VVVQQHARAIGAADVRAVLGEVGGDLRAVGDRLGLATHEILMILAYDITVTSTQKKSQRTASGVFDTLIVDERETEPPNDS
jgi:hypothetical protein